MGAIEPRPASLARPFRCRPHPAAIFGTGAVSMPTWIRFRFDNGDTTLVNADETHILFKAEDQKIEVYPAVAGVGKEPAQPICVFTCEYPEQVTAAEELIFDALSKAQSTTLSLDLLD